MARSSRTTPVFRLKPITAAILCTGGAMAFGAQAQESQPTPAAEVPAAEAPATQPQGTPKGAQMLEPITVRGTALKTDVDSPKFTAPLLDTPQTVSIIPSEIFNQQGAQNLTDVLRNTPGISFSGGENGFAANTNTFNLRGFDATSHVFIDGSRDSGNYSRDIFNVEQVEVAKGAASDNGRGGAGGYLNLVTKAPRLENFVAGTVSYGVDEYSSEDRSRATVDVNRRLGDTAAARVNLLWSDGGKAGRDQVELGTWGIAPSVAIGLGTGLRAIASFQHIEQDDRPDFGVPGITIPGTHQYNQLYGSASRDLYYGSVSDFDETTSDSALLRLEYDLWAGATVSNRTRWAETERRGIFTLINNANLAQDPSAVGFAPEVTRYRQGYYRDNTSLSNTTNLSAEFNTGRFKHSVAAGLEVSKEETHALRQGGGVGTAPNTPILNPDSSPLTGALTGTDASDIDIKTLAAYVYDTVQLSERWQVTGGLRVERYDVEIRSNNPATDLEGSETTLGGKLGVVYKPASNGAVYLSVSRAAELPGDYLSNPDISRTGANGLPGLADGVNDPDNKPRVSVNVELGTKWELLDERLLLSAAVFRTEKRNVAITGREGAETANTLKGYGKQIVEGLELGASGKISDAWSVFGGLVLLDSERNHSAYLDEVRCNGASAGDYGNSGVPAPICGLTRTSGDELAFTPKVSANLWTTYKTTGGFTLGLGGQHVGEQFLGRPSDADRIIKNGQYGTLPSYTVVNALISYPVNTNFTARLNIDNLFDKTYAVAANWQGHLINLGSSRAALLSVDYRF